MYRKYVLRKYVLNLNRYDTVIVPKKVSWCSGSNWNTAQHFQCVETADTFKPHKNAVRSRKLFICYTIIS